MIWKKQPVGSKLADLQNNKASKDAATQSAAGLMSASDKTKLDGVATGATAVSVVDNLNSDSSTSALSAAQGKELNGNTVHNHQGGADAVDYCQIGFNSDVPEIRIHDKVNNTWYHETLSPLNQATPHNSLNSNIVHQAIDAAYLTTPLDTTSTVKTFERIGKNIYITFRGADRSHSENETFIQIPAGYRPSGDRYFPIIINPGGIAVGIMKANGDVQVWSSNPPYGRIICMLSYAAD